MLIEHDRLSYKLEVIRLEDGVDYTIEVAPCHDPDIQLEGTLVLKDCHITLDYEGFQLFVGGNLTFTVGQSEYINVALEVTDDTEMRRELQELVLSL